MELNHSASGEKAHSQVYTHNFQPWLLDFLFNSQALKKLKEEKKKKKTLERADKELDMATFVV